jgi:hypothetical protein
MKTRDIRRALAWSEKYEHQDELANYFFRVCVTLGTFIAPPEVSIKLIPYQHFVVEDELYKLRDEVAKTILQNIKGKRI